MKALEVEESTLSTKYIGIIVTYNLIGSAYLSQRRKKDAATYFQRAVKRYERIMGPMDPKTAGEYDAIGDAHSDIKEYGEALKYHVRALEIREKVLGPQHQDTIDVRNSVVRDYTCLMDIVQQAIRLIPVNRQTEAGPEQKNERDRNNASK